MPKSKRKTVKGEIERERENQRLRGERENQGDCEEKERRQYTNREEGYGIGDKIVLYLWQHCRHKRLKMLPQLNSKRCRSINLNLDKYWNIL